MKDKKIVFYVKLGLIRNFTSNLLNYIDGSKISLELITTKKRAGK